MREHAVITRGVGGALRVPGRPDLPVMVLLRAGCDAPAVVRVVVLLGTDDSLEVVVPTSALRAGLIAPTRDGEPHVSVVGTEAVVEVRGLALVLATADLVDLLASHEGCTAHAGHGPTPVPTQTPRHLSGA